MIYFIINKDVTRPHNFIKIEEIEIPIYKLKVDFDIITFEEPICAHLIDIKRFTQANTKMENGDHLVTWSGNHRPLSNASNQISVACCS